MRSTWSAQWSTGPPAWGRRVNFVVCVCVLRVVCVTGRRDECVLRVYGAADVNRARVRGHANDAHSATHDLVCFTTAYHAGAHKCVCVLRADGTRHADGAR
eukprot:7006411-Prymnesium_polylepis.1